MKKQRNIIMDEERQEEKNPLIREIMEYIVWFAAVIVAVQFITRYIGVFSVVDGESMEPTLYHGEYLWVDKLDYHLSEPERFDVVIFPVDYNGEIRHFVKRIIALPEETVYIDEKGNIIIDTVQRNRLPWGRTNILCLVITGIIAQTVEPILLGM